MSATEAPPRRGRRTTPEEAKRMNDAAGITDDRASAQADHDGGAPDPPASAQAPSEAVSQLDGVLWEELIGGEKPSGLKIRLMGGAVEIPMPAGGIKKGRRYILRVEAVSSGVGFDDHEDTKTQQVTATIETRKLKIRSARIVSD